MSVVDPPLLRFLTAHQWLLQAPRTRSAAKGSEHPSAAAPRAAGNRLMRSSSVAHKIRVYVYPAAKELKRGQRRRCCWRRRRSRSPAQGRHERDHINLFVLLLLILFVVSRSQIVHNLYFFLKFVNNLMTFVNNLTYISLVSEIHRKNLKNLAYICLKSAIITKLHHLIQ
jgi:hypothetical protein